MNDVGETVAGPFLIALRPEVADELVAAAPLLAGDGEDRENGQRALLRSAARDCSRRVF